MTVSRIAETSDYEVTPSFSPDGKRIVYAAGVPGDRADHIFTIGRDGSEKTQLTNEDANDTAPQFSPDGSLIVFARDTTYQWGGQAANWENGGVICVIGADGTNLQQLTPAGSYAYAPSFAPDGKTVYYFGEKGLFAVSLDTPGSHKRIGPSVAYASFAPNGKSIVYADGKYSPDFELFVASPNGQGKSQLTVSENGCFHPVFAHAGDSVYFLMEQWPHGPSGTPKSSIWSVKPDGTQQKELTDLSMFDDPINWEPSR